jgi:hypothetical protein
MKTREERAEEERYREGLRKDLADCTLAARGPPAARGSQVRNRRAVEATRCHRPESGDRTTELLGQGHSGGCP